MVMPFCGDGKEDMFYQYSWNFTQFRQDCEKKYGMTPNLNVATKMFGGSDIGAASNIVFSNGDIDPWSGGWYLERFSVLVHSLRCEWNTMSPPRGKRIRSMSS